MALKAHPFPTANLADLVRAWLSRRSRYQDTMNFEIKGRMQVLDGEPRLYDFEAKIDGDTVFRAENE